MWAVNKVLFLMYVVCCLSASTAQKKIKALMESDCDQNGLN